ncbi:hypothetical protein GQ53DRAFT_596724, partial [Thozetella sp. PMI_491]
SHRRGPQIYVRVEFGVSFSAKAPKPREITYRSRGLRERSPIFPRQVAAPNTNYLAAIHDFQQRQERHRRHQEQHQHQHHAQQRQLPRGEHEARAERYQEVVPEGNQDTLRPSRADSRSSRERGHSAPPPIGENPWDVNVGQEPAARYPSGSTDASRGPPQVWKALPAAPSQFRLGEDGMPWSASSWPGGEPSAYPQDDEPVSSVESRRREARQPPMDISPSMGSVYSPVQSLSPWTQARDQDPARVSDLEALSAAMMTVDNGFENQWWNQGPRESTSAPDFTPAAPALRSSIGSLGWAVANATWTTPTREPREQRGSLSSANLVSPVTDYLGSPPPIYSNLQRSMTTRSEELFFTE